MDRQQKIRFYITLFLFAALTAASAVGCLLSGSVEIPASGVWNALAGGEVTRESWRAIVVETRLPMVITAMVAGSALAVCGLLLQTCFNNPLAGPSILGISTGASLGVAIVVMAFGGVLAAGAGVYIGTLAGALAGAFVVLALLMSLSKIVRSNSMVLIAGILVGYFASSAIALLNYWSSAENAYSFTIWGLGSLTGGSLSRSLIFAALGLMTVALSMRFIKPLNALLLGDRYAESMGVDVRRVRGRLLLTTGLLTAIVTAFCGPIGFIGLIVPHIARMGCRTSNHLKLMPLTALCGSAVALLCAWLSVAFGGQGIIPINAITPIVGVPVVIYVIVNRRKLHYFD